MRKSPIEFRGLAFLCALLLCGNVAHAGTRGIPATTATQILKLARAPKPDAYLGNIVTPNQVPERVYRKYDLMTRAGLKAARAPGAISPQMRTFITHTRSTAQNALYAEKDEALKQLGLPTSGTGTLYILVSSSMPKKMLREYAAQAIYTGAIIDFRGVLKNKPYPLTWFLKHEILPLLSLNRNARPTVTIDPRPFYVWNVHAVPAIIYTHVPGMRMCEHQVVRYTPAMNSHRQRIRVPYHVCAPMSPSKYWEMQGAVTLKYALKKFIADGATGAKPLLKALDDGNFPNGKNIRGIKASIYAKMQTPGGMDTILDTLKSEGYYAEDSQAFNLKNPGDFARPDTASVNRALGNYSSEISRR
ncbi:TrbC family F-type conjugative pilus assembly protein [Acidithiobacillus sp. M4-SHS-6]|uniref:TrbC family F-type conjugative pilus assembly protein n=1 Tax=Acidithiobacillus sp. M4-SHS-6 TaxID=3383024 RepID=UPI0039BDE4D0